MVDAYGPIYAAGFQHITKSGYEILYLPDLHNDELQREGKAPVYWWLPNEVRLARKDGDSGDYKFHFTHFLGTRSASTNVGVEQTEDVAGGLLGFSTTSAPPASVLQESEDELLNRFRGNDDKYWGWRTPVAPMFRPAPIVSNTMTITNFSPNTNGGVPAALPQANRSRNGSMPPAIRAIASPPIFKSPRSTPLRKAYRTSNLDQWYANLQGQGNGSVSPFAENAFSGLVGSMPAALIWASFHGGTGGISVWQNLKIKVWSPAVHLHIEGDWDRIQTHFSTAAHAGGLYWSADLQAEFNNMVIDGTIQVVTEVDTTIPNADKLEEEMNKTKELVFQKFMEQAQKMIFDPAPFNEKPAEASGGFLGFGGGAAFKLRVDQTHQHLVYDEHKEVAYLQGYPISGQLTGMYDEIKADPSAEKKYFTTLDMGDWERVVPRAVKAVVNWPDPSRKWVGEPVAFLSAQIGYPNSQGAVQWDGHIFQSTDSPDAFWTTRTAMKKVEDVANPPAEWTPDLTFVKRQVHFTEPPSETENPFVRVAVEKNMLDLDPGDNGRLLNDINLEVRVDSVGALNVGPIFLDVDLESPKQVVEVEFQAKGQTDAHHDRTPVKFSWQYNDQTEPRYWMIYTGQLDFVPRYQYQVHVIVKGSIFTKGQEWLGPWVDCSGNGPLTISVPTADADDIAAGVKKRSLVPRAIVATAKNASKQGLATGKVSSQPKLAGWTATKTASSNGGSREIASTEEEPTEPTFSDFFKAPTK